MHYTYVLLSAKDGQFCTGTTHSLRLRLAAHRAGRVRSTAHRLPLALIYYEAGLNEDDAFRRERFLKTGKGKRYIKNRLAGFLSSVGPEKLERH